MLYSYSLLFCIYMLLKSHLRCSQNHILLESSWYPTHGQKLADEVK